MTNDNCKADLTDEQSLQQDQNICKAMDAEFFLKNICRNYCGTPGQMV